MGAKLAIPLVKVSFHLSEKDGSHDGTGTLGLKHGARSETHRYDKGIHYTPASLVNYLTSRVLGSAFDGLSPGQVLQRRILDPSCGCGVFLVAALRYIFAWFEEARQFTDTQGESSGLSLQERMEIMRKRLCRGSLPEPISICCLVEIGWLRAVGNSRGNGTLSLRFLPSDSRVIRRSLVA